MKKKAKRLRYTTAAKHVAVGNRLQHFLATYYTDNQRNLVKSLKISQPVLSRVLNGWQFPSVSLLTALLKLPTHGVINIHWLVTGVGDSALRPSDENMVDFRVTWQIDLMAAGPIQAAKEALAIHRDPVSLATEFSVRNTQTGEVTTVDAARAWRSQC